MSEFSPLGGNEGYGGYEDDMAGYTEHYQLHQWEAGDDFLRTDFNEDFAKIDEALHESSTRLKLMEVTVPEDGTELTLDLAGLALTRFSALELQGQMRTDSGLRMTVNDIGTGGYRVSTSQSTETLSAADYCMLCTAGNSTACAFLLRLSRFLSNTAFGCHTVNEASSLYSRGYIPGCAWEEIQTIRLSCFNERLLRAGSIITVYGLV